MYYQFNNFTGRLIGAHQGTQPYFPISPVPLNKNEPPKIMFETPDIKPARETPRRPMSSKNFIPGTNKQYGEVSQKMREKMERFQRNDGVLVHLKGGPFDRILFATTIGLCIVGTGLSLHLIYTMSFPKKQ